MNRNIELDILKGLAIILMVIGHTNFWGINYIYLFHMAVFFMASGYFFKNENTSSKTKLFKYIKKKIISLWFPYFIWNTVFIWLNNFFVKINFYTDNKAFLDEVSGTYNILHNYMSLKEMIIQTVKSFCFVGGTTMGGAFWFFRILFEISILYAVINYCIMKFAKCERNILISQGIISIIFLGLGYICSVKSISFAGNSQITLSCYCLYFAGYLINKNPVKLEKKYLKVLALSLSAFLLFVCSKLGGVSLGSNYYKNPLFLIVTSFLGWILLYEMSFFISKLEFIKNVLLYIGKNTISIVLFHFLAFKIVNYIQVIVYHKPSYLVAGFPVLYSFGGWWILYAIVGVAVPLLMRCIWRKTIWIIKESYLSIKKRQKIGLNGQER